MMGDLKNCVNLPAFHGHAVYMVTNDDNQIWISAVDLIHAAAHRKASADKLVSYLPDNWVLRQAGMPVMVNEPGAYCIIFELCDYDLAGWLYKAIKAGVTGRNNGMTSPD